MTRLEDTIRSFVRLRIEAMTERSADGEPVDLHTEFSSAIPTFVLAELFGLPESDRERFSPWVQTLTRLQNEGFDANVLVGDSTVDPDAQAGVRVIGEMFEYFTSAITAARREPGDDLLGRLVTAEVDGERLGDWDILGFCFVVTAGGADTTASLISHTVLLTGQEMDQRELLVADPALIPGASWSACATSPPCRAWPAPPAQTWRSAGSRSRSARRC